jgi:hypothetical protein
MNKEDNSSKKGYGCTCTWTYNTSTEPLQPTFVASLVTSNEQDKNVKVYRWLGHQVMSIPNMTVWVRWAKKGYGYKWTRKKIWYWIEIGIM